MKKNSLLCAALSLFLSLGGMLQPVLAEQVTEADTVHVDEEQAAARQTGLSGITAENYPRVDGSTATLPLSQAVYRLATGASQVQADEAIVHTKTTNSYLELIAGNTDLLIVADKNEKVDQAIAESGVELEIKPIALDAFLFMTNEANPVKSLTKEQIVSIYAGEITNWSQVGGEDKPIVAFQRNENAGSQTAMKSLVMQGRQMVEPKELTIYTMSDLLTSVASYNNEANALGYSYYYYASLMVKTPGLRFMAVDGVVPSNESVQRGEYPYIAGYYAVVRKSEGDTPARQVFDWLTSRQAQEMIADMGYVPVDAEIKPEIIHAGEELNGPLPIGEDECLAVVINRTTLYFIDRDGSVIRRMSGAAIGNNSETVTNGEPVRIEVVKKNQPQLVMKMMDDDSFKIGLYLPAEDRFTIEPQYWELNKIKDLYTDSSMRAPSTGPTLLFQMYCSKLSGRYSLASSLRAAITAFLCARSM